MASIIEQKKIYDDSKPAFNNLLADLTKLNREVRKLAKSNKALSESLQLVKKSSDGEEARKLKEGTDKLTTSTRKLKKARTDAQIVAQQLVKQNKKLSQTYTPQARALAVLRQKTLEQNKALREQAKATLGVKKGLSSLTKQMFAGVGILAGLRILGNVLKDAFKTFTEFSKAGSGLAAILNKTKEEVSSLTDQAKKLGGTTAFTAAQVVKLQTELARLGFSISEIRNATPAILDLGAALGVELADAASVAGGVVRAFGLSTKDTKEVVDSMVATMSNSGAAFEDYREAVKLSAPIFKAANIDFKTMNLLIGNLADSQIKGSLAGTGLKNLISKLSNENSKLSKELGFTVKNSDDLVKAFEVLKTKNIDLTEATELTDERSKAAFLTLIQGVDSADKLSVALNNLDDNAKKTAKTMLDNVAGDITMADSAWTKFVLSIADGDGIISKATRGIIKSFTGLLGTLTQFNEVGFVDKTKMMANGMLALVGVGEDYRFSIETSTKVMTDLGDKQNFAVRQTKQVTEATEDEKDETVKLTAAQREAIKAQNDLNAAKKAANFSRGLDIPSTISGGGVVTSVDPIAAKRSEYDKLLGLNQTYLEQKANQEAVAAEVETELAIERAITLEEALAVLAEEALEIGAQLAMDVFNSIQQEKIEKIQENADTQIKILQDQLDKGLISEDEFTKKKEKIENKARYEKAKADRNAALWAILINTAVAVIKSLTTTPLPAGLIPMIATIGIGALQAAAVLAQPLPKLAEGEVDIGGKSHAQGGISAEIEGGESVINKHSTKKSKGLLNMINDGIITDKTPLSNYNIMSMDGLIEEFKENKALTRKTNELLGNLYSTHTINNIVYRKTSRGEIFKQKNK